MIQLLGDVNEGLLSRAYLFDIQKYFDTIDHNILLHVVMISCLLNDCTNRNYIVFYDLFTSAFMLALTGRQGRILSLCN